MTNPTTTVGKLEKYKPCMSGLRSLVKVLKVDNVYNGSCTTFTMEQLSRIGNMDDIMWGLRAFTIKEQCPILRAMLETDFIGRYDVSGNRCKGLKDDFRKHIRLRIRKARMVLTRLAYFEDVEEAKVAITMCTPKGYNRGDCARDLFADYTLQLNFKELAEDMWDSLIYSRYGSFEKAFYEYVRTESTYFEPVRVELVTESEDHRTLVACCEPAHGKSRAA